MRAKVSNLQETGNEATIAQIKNTRAVITATKMFEGQPRLLCEASSLGIPSIYPSFGEWMTFLMTIIYLLNNTIIQI